MYFYKDYGGISYWVGDGFCDDINNNEACDYDDGDCCGLSSVKKNFCVQCICKGKPNSFKMMKETESIIIFPQYLRAKMIRIVMEMVTAMPINVNAQQIMSMHKIAPIMDVSTNSV